MLRKFWHHPLWVALAALLSLTALPAAGFDSVAVVIGTESPASIEFVQALRKELNARNGNPPAFSVSLTAAGLGASGKPLPDLIIAVGVQALQQSAALADRSAVLGVLVPRQAYQKIRDETPAGHTLSAITLDQPWSRQLSLLRKLLPKAQQLGLLVGPGNAELAAQLARPAQAYQLQTIARAIDSEAQLPAALAQLLQECDVLLATPDPLVYTRDTAQTILLTSYRHQKPVFGFSKAYVTAGALAAIYSTPEQIARQAAEIVLQDAVRSPALPAAQPPRYFSVATNRQVARSLGIAMDSETLLADKIRIEEASP